MERTADVHLRTEALQDFAGNPAIDVDVEAVRRHATEAMNGKSVMEEGIAFNEKHKKAIDQVLRQLMTAKQGTDTYREGGTNMFIAYTKGEELIEEAHLAVPEFAAGAAEQTRQI